MTHLSNFEGQPIAFIPDPHHLIKSIRNGLFTHEVLHLSDEFVTKLELPSNKVKLKYILDLAAFDEKRQLKVAPHIKPKDVVIQNYSKMKVAPAKRLLSKRTAVALEFMVEHHGWPEEALATANFCHFIGHWIDIMSCKTEVLAFSLHDEVKYNEQIEFMKGFQKFITGIYTSKRQKMYKPWAKGALMATESMIWLSNYLLKEVDHKFNYLMGGHLLGDPIEWLHAMIRAIQKAPTCLNYSRYLKAVSITQALNSRIAGISYEYDDSTFWTDFKDIKRLKDAQKKALADENEFDENEIDNEDDDFFVASEFEPGDTTNDAVIATLASYTIKKTILGKCQACSDFFIQKPDDENQDVNKLVHARQYSQQALALPSIMANKIFQYVEACFICNIESFQAKERVVDRLRDAIAPSTNDRFDNIPSCHFSTIIGRFIKCKYIHWTEQRDWISKNDNRGTIIQESFASRTTRSLTAANLQ